MNEPTNYDPKGLAQICASFDEGGGVALGDAFVIYSIVASSPDWSTTAFKSGLQAELISAASAVGNAIPVLVTTEKVFTVDLVSLPCLEHPPFNSARETSPRDSLPWFLINASKFPKHQIVGRETLVESLLVILQRPWCVLELCCCNSPAISAIHQFATIAAKIIPEIYNNALVLLHQELRRRTVPSLGDLKHLKLSFAKLDTTWFTIKEVYTNLSSSRLRSHNSFWLRLISTCALYLDISCSDLVRILSYTTSRGVHFSEQKHAAHKEHYSSIEQMSLGSHSSVTISTFKPVLLKRSTLSLNDQEKCLTLHDLELWSCELQFLLLTYQQVLHIISESLS
ncbi:hypothetical protein PEX1_056050 [Penicillium expansum]|nr:hypothetical protein PEX1_056050 [Penicillium expansum]